ncbi:MAG: xanthine dehydrogenase accessory protein XdhC [Hyphomicrobiaceae bacterium]
MLQRMGLIADILASVANDGAIVRVTVAATEGSAPREVGAAMTVSASAIAGTIGGGALELDAIAAARVLLRGDGGRDGLGFARQVRKVALGPALGQCCGGAVTLLFERFGRTETETLRELAAEGGESVAAGETAARPAAMLARPMASGGPPLVLSTARTRTAGLPPPLARALERALIAPDAAGRGAALLVPARGDRPAWLIEPIHPPVHPLFLYGAGHVGRAIVRVLEDLPFRATWIDVATDRFPDRVRPQVTAIATTDPAAVARAAPAGAVHLVMTHSHPLDLAICHAALSRGGFGHLGLIGSATKAARFRKRLAAAGIAAEALARLRCPIGLAGIAGKSPAVIAVAVAAELVLWSEGRAASERAAGRGEEAHGRPADPRDR